MRAAYIPLRMNVHWLGLITPQLKSRQGLQIEPYAFKEGAISDQNQYTYKEHYSSIWEESALPKGR